MQSNAGRIIMNGFPTGVEAVSHAIVRYMLYFRRKQQHSSHGLNHFAGAWWPQGPIPHCPTAEQRQLHLVPFIDSPVSRAFKFFRNLFFQASLRAATL